jgi:hypothetical protein
MARPDSFELAFEPFNAARRGGIEASKPAALLKKKAPQLHAWLRQLFRSDEDINLHVVVRDRTKPDGPTHLTVSMWGFVHEYVVSATLPSGKKVPQLVGGKRKVRGVARMVPDTGYLGLGVVARAPYAGEQHRRGRDGWDGPFTKETWDTIARDILLDSLQPLHEWARNRRGDGPMPVPFVVRGAQGKRRITKHKAKRNRT